VNSFGIWKLSLLAAVAVVLAACAGNKQSPEDEARAAFDDVRAAIQEVVTDQERAARATELVSEMEQVFKDAAVSVDERREAFRTLSSNYDASQAELEAALERVREGMRENYQKYSETRRRLASVLTNEEWETLQKKRSEALNKALAAARI
jgi:DNA repair exonuclease SbcCD ATPase subunit